MKYCHSCGAQFPDSYKRCIHCGRKLYGDSPSRPSAHAPTPSRSDLHCLCSRQPPFISRLAARLKAAGIQPFVEADPGADRVNIRHGSYGHQVVLHLFVHDNDRDHAEAVMADLVRERVPDIPEDLEENAVQEGRCPACSSNLPKNAQECPDCGLAFPES